MLKHLLWGLTLIIGLNALNPGRVDAFTGRRLEIQEVSIPVAEGIALTGKLYQRKDLGKRQPSVIFVSPWSVGIWIYDAKARVLAEQGYTVLAYNPRGWGGSGGAVDSAGPDDVADAARVVDWLIVNSKADPNRLGMAGISLGAGTSLMAAAHDPRIRAVVALSGWTDLFTSTFGNQTERRLWSRILALSAEVLGGTSTAGQGADAYIKTGELEKIKTYTDPRSPVFLLDRYKEQQTAIFLSQNFSDFLFPVSDVWAFFERLESPKRIRLQPGIHASAEVLEIFFERQDELWLDAQAWLDLWVRDRGISAERPNEIHLAIPGERRDLRYPRLEDLEVKPRRYYLKESYQRGFDKLSAEVPQVPGVQNIRSALVSGVNAGIPLIYPLIDSLKPIETNMSSRGIRLDRAAVYEWGPFRGKARMLGIPRLQLKLASSSGAFQLIAYLFKVTARDEWKLISIAPYTQANGVPGEPGVLAFDQFNGFASFERGEKLVLALDTYDPEFAAADMQDFVLGVYADGSSFIDIPWAKSIP